MCFTPAAARRRLTRRRSRGGSPASAVREAPARLAELVALAEPEDRPGRHLEDERGARGVRKRAVPNVEVPLLPVLGLVERGDPLERRLFPEAHGVALDDQSSPSSMALHPVVRVQWR